MTTTATIEIVDRGRGPQLSTHRVTVQDVLPYVREGSTNDQIREEVAELSDEEIDALRGYIQDNYQEVADLERRIAERNSKRKNPPHIQKMLEEGVKELRNLMERIKAAKQEAPTHAGNPR